MQTPDERNEPLSVVRWTDRQGVEHEAWCTDPAAARQVQAALRGDARQCSVQPSVEDVEET